MKLTRLIEFSRQADKWARAINKDGEELSPSLALFAWLTETPDGWLAAQEIAGCDGGSTFDAWVSGCFADYLDEGKRVHLWDRPELADNNAVPVVVTVRRK